MDTGVIEGGLNVTLTIRLLMHGKVGVWGTRGCAEAPSSEVGWPFWQPGWRPGASMAVNRRRSDLSELPRYCSSH